jgi:hypothetical protein
LANLAGLASVLAMPLEVLDLPEYVFDIAL